ncbi:PepSY domain-containing protein [Nitrosococcus oceani]|uniref:PepSY domain-containing protein n=1 Tax=Nitrosococcus oceani TaxID=1229 RepID=UPI000A7559ED|nr:PepSY domain-containing protein [Nitrosococcus oceani]
MANQLKTEASRRRWRPIWRKVHLYLALTVGFFFVLLGLTGSVNVFHVELAELGLPALERQAQGETPVSLDNIMANIRQAHPQRQGRWTLYLPGYGQDYLWAVYPNPLKRPPMKFSPLYWFKSIPTPASLRPSIFGGKRSRP